jgi:hypothetical protein
MLWSEGLGETSVINRNVATRCHTHGTQGPSKETISLNHAPSRARIAYS